MTVDPAQIPEFVSSRPMLSKAKELAEQRLFTMAAVDSNLPVDALDIIIEAFPRSFTRRTYGVDGDYLRRLTYQRRHTKYSKTIEEAEGKAIAMRRELMPFSQEPEGGRNETHSQGN